MKGTLQIVSLNSSLKTDQEIFFNKILKKATPRGKHMLFFKENIINVCENSRYLQAFNFSINS